MKDVALITGASSGIGLELAKIHASKRRDLILVARRLNRLEELKEELSSKYGVEVMVIEKDLSKIHAATELYEKIKETGVQIDFLINNAGFGGHGRFHERDWDRDFDMIQLNIAALAELTHCFLPEMVERKKGRVLNLASMAAFLPGPYQAVYYATKAFVLSFSEAIASELDGTGVTVTALCPGPTKTEFEQVAEVTGTKAFMINASVRSVATYGYAAMMRGQTVAVPGTTNRLLVHYLLRMTPKKVARRVSKLLMEK
ncbi:MAG: SDR family oxidoreductase [Candidatus Melainabacteria bacterium]|nr:SDR family oxidoreductase [Candidatus Melainabacteria bacterium]